MVNSKRGGVVKWATLRKMYPWANYVAMDENSSVYVFDSEPSQHEGLWVPRIDQFAVRLVSFRYIGNAKNMDGVDWRQTLIAYDDPFLEVFRFEEDPGIWRPDGYELDAFIDSVCEHCEYDKGFREKQENPCKLLAQATGEVFTDAWIIRDGKGVCTKFIKEGDPIDIREELESAGQMRLFK